MTTNLTKPPKPVPPDDRSLERLLSLLPLPSGHLLIGRRAAVVILPDNIVCFRRRTATELNYPQRGRALHHRHVLIIALQTAVTVCLDDRAIRLKAGEGILIFPFQFHDYIQPEDKSLNWLFVTFELPPSNDLDALRYRPFPVSPMLRSLVTDLLMPTQEGLETILQMRRTNPAVKIIAISGGGHIPAKDYLALAEKCGAARTLTKPFTPQEILNAIK